MGNYTPLMERLVPMKIRNQSAKCKTKEVIRRRRIPQFWFLMFDLYISLVVMLFESVSTEFRAERFSVDSQPFGGFAFVTVTHLECPGDVLFFDIDKTLGPVRV